MEMTLISVQSDGRTAGITLPSANAQEKVIRKAYQSAHLDLHRTDYVECHGTGTLVGDAIELEGLSKVFKRSHETPLLVGSVCTSLLIPRLSQCSEPLMWTRHRT